MYKECINLLYFCFGEESDLADGAKLKVIGYGEVRNIVVVSGFWMGVMGYAILLSWRAYEKSKCKLF